MNKKRFFIFLTATVLITAIAIISFVTKPEPKPALLTANREEEVKLFYYRAVPGLKIAEELDLVVPLYKRLDISGMDAKVNIDSIWYNNKTINIFYHIEGLLKEAYLGGDLYLPSKEPDKKTPFWGLHTIGRANEKGIYYGSNFYSCLTLPVLKDKYHNQLNEVETMIFSPFINLPLKKDNKLEAIQLKSFDINIKYKIETEPVVKIPIDSQIEFDQRKLRFYQFDRSPSANRIYFQYQNSGRDKVYRLKGRYTTSKGDTVSFDAYPEVLTEYPFHYYMEIPPFNISATDFQLFVEDLYCVGEDSAVFEVKPGLYTNKKGKHEVEIGKDSIKGTELYINKITLDDEYVELNLKATASIDKIEPYTRLDLKSPLLHSYNDSMGVQAANIITIQDGDFNYYNLDDYAFGLITHPGAGISIKLSREYWNEKDTLYIKLNNLSYLYRLNRDINISLEN